MASKVKSLNVSAKELKKITGLLESAYASSSEAKKLDGKLSEAKANTAESYNDAIFCMSEAGFDTSAKVMANIHLFFPEWKAGVSFGTTKANIMKNKKVKKPAGFDKINSFQVYLYRFLPKGTDTVLTIEEAKKYRIAKLEANKVEKTGAPRTMEKVKVDESLPGLVATITDRLKDESDTKKVKATIRSLELLIKAYKAMM